MSEYQFRVMDVVELVESVEKPWPLVGPRWMIGCVGWVSATSEDLKERPEFSGLQMDISDWYGVMVDGEEWQIPEGRLRLVWRGGVL